MTVFSAGVVLDDSAVSQPLSQHFVEELWMFSSCLINGLQIALTS